MGQVTGYAGEPVSLHVAMRMHDNVPKTERSSCMTTQDDESGTQHCAHAAARGVVYVLMGETAVAALGVFHAR